MAISYFKSFTSLGIVIVGISLSSCAHNYTQADLEKLKQANTYFQSDSYKKLQAFFAGMAAAPSGGSGWDALASGNKYLQHYPYSPPPSRSCRTYCMGSSFCQTDCD